MMEAMSIQAGARSAALVLICGGLACLAGPGMASEASQPAPQCQAPAGRAAEQIIGHVSAGQRFSQTTPSGWQLRLAPIQFGWQLEVGAKLQGDDDYSRLTPPLHGVPNPRQIEGWHFRNADNTGPNDGSVNAPRQLRQFIFSPLVGNGIDYDGSATSSQDVERVRAYGQGWLFIENSALSPVARGQKASFQSMVFTACLTWPAEAGPPWMDQEDQAIARLKNLDVKELDPKLGNAAFKYWFIVSVAAPRAPITYELNDCGEQSGGNDGDRDIPLCVEVRTTTRSGAEASAMILVGSVSSGVLSGTPVIFSAGLQQGDRYQSVKSLGELTRDMAALAPAPTPVAAQPMPTGLASELKASFDQEPCNQHTRKLMAGFTVTWGDVNVAGGDCDNTPDFKTRTRAIDLDGASGSVLESDQLFPAGNYRLEFALAGHPFRPGTVRVELGNFSKEYRREARQAFATEQDIVTVETPSRLKFTFDRDGEGGPTLDGIVVVKSDRAPVPVNDDKTALRLAIEHYRASVDAKGPPGDPRIVWKNDVRDEWVVMWGELAVIVSARSGLVHHYVADMGTD
jgi:hypothetical protein